ncbi:hypothetical protein BGZ93_004237, partial [Podila epicladia]
MTEMLFKEHRRLLAIGVALLCLAVSKNMFETGMATIFQKKLMDSTIRPHFLFPPSRPSHQIPAPNMLLTPLLIMHNEKNVPSIGFTLTVADLAPLTDPAHLKELGGIDKICQGLCVDPTI